MNIEVVAGRNLGNSVDKVIISVLGHDLMRNLVRVFNLHFFVIVIQEENLQKPKYRHKNDGKKDKVKPELKL